MFPFDMNNLDPEFLQSLSNPEMLAKFQELMTRLPEMTPYEQAAAVQSFANDNFTDDQMNKMVQIAQNIPEKDRNVIIDATNRMLYVGKPSAHFSVTADGRNASFEAYTLGATSESDAPVFVAFSDVPDKDFLAEVDTYIGKQEIVVWANPEEAEAFAALHQDILG